MALHDAEGVLTEPVLAQREVKELLNPLQEPQRPMKENICS